MTSPADRFTPEFFEMERWERSYLRNEHDNCHILVGPSMIVYQHTCGLLPIPYPVKVKS